MSDLLLNLIGLIEKGPYGRAQYGNADDVRNDEA